MSELALSKLGGRDANPYVIVESSYLTRADASENGGYVNTRIPILQATAKLVKPSESGVHTAHQTSIVGYISGKNKTLQDVNASGMCFFHIQENLNVAQVTIDSDLSNDIILCCPYLGSSATITVPVQVKKDNTVIIEGDMVVVAMYGSAKAVSEEMRNQIRSLFGNSESLPSLNASLNLTGIGFYAYLINATYSNGYKNYSQNFGLSAYCNEVCGPSVESSGRLDRYDGIDPPYESPTQ